MLPETPYQEANAESQPPLELEPDVDAQDTGSWKACQMQSIVCQMQFDL